MLYVTVLSRTFQLIFNLLITISSAALQLIQQPTEHGLEALM